MAIDLDMLNTDISEFNEKYEGTKLETPEELNAYTADADLILGKYPDPDGEAKKALGKFCSHLGCWVTVFGQDLERGVGYYHKSLKFDPGSYDINWEYYTTLEEIIEDEDYAAPELIEDAVNCLRACIECCNTPELKQKHYVHFRYLDLGNTYLIAKQPAKAAKCAKMSMKLEPNDRARQLLKRANKELGFFGRIRALFEKI